MAKSIPFWSEPQGEGGGRVSSGVLSFGVGCSSGILFVVIFESGVMGVKFDTCSVEGVSTVEFEMISAEFGSDVFLDEAGDF